MLSKKRTPKFARARNSTTDRLACTSIMFFGVKKGPISAKYGKHRAKQELETVPPQELGTVPPQGSKKKASEVVLFLTIRWYCF